MPEPKRPSSSSEALRKLKQRSHPDASEPSPPPRYEMLGELGRGGVGVVYRGRDIDLSREVAMKVLHPEFADNPEVLDRFVEEAQIGGQLQHPGIVPVYEVGLQADDRPFFAMKLIKGVTLWQQLSQRERLDEHRQQFLAAFLQVCQTMAYAHARRVVHRDLKPENVMVGSFGEVQVVDWGFAKVLPKDGESEPQKRSPADGTNEPPKSVIETIRSQAGDEGSRSMLGSVLGTPAYMPREQALGDVDHMDLRSDVFGLGGILCEILTGGPPYRGKGHETLLQAARADLKDAWQRLDECGANAALIELCKRCLQAEPEARPDSAQQVADEVAAYLASVEQRARAAEVKAAEARVRARATVMLAAAALLLVLLGGGGWWYLQQAQAKRVADATQLASEARAAANLALGEARAGGFADAMRWQRASDAAAQAQRLADAADVPSDERARSATLVATISGEVAAAASRRAQRAKDEQMERDLAGVYAATRLDEISGSKHDRQLRHARRNADLFRDYCGVDLDGLTVEQAVDRLRGSEILPALVAGLDNWAYSRADVEPAEHDAFSTRLWAIARALDDGAPRREAVRSILQTRAFDHDRLTQLVADADWSSMAPHDFQLLEGALTEAGMYRDAVAVLRRGVDHHPQSYMLFVRLSERLAGLPDADYEGAIAAARTARAIDPTPLGERQIAACETQLGRFDEALPKLQSLVERFPDDSSVWNQMGLLHLANDRIDVGQQCFARAVELMPSPEALCNLGTCHLEREQYEDSERCYREALALQPGYANGWSNLAVALQRLGRLDEAEQAVEKALALAPEHATAYVVLASIRQSQRRFAEAEALARRCLEINPDSRLGLAAHGQALRSLGRVDEALAAMEKAVEVDEHDAAIHCNYAQLLADTGRAEQALAHLAAKRADLRDHAVLYITQAHCERVLGRLADAEQSLRTAIEKFPDEELSHFALAQVVGAQGRHQDALRALRRAEELGLDTPELHSNLAACLGALGRGDEAFLEAQRAVEADPAHAPSQFNLFQALARRGDVAGGIEHLRVAHSLWAQDLTGFGRLWHERSTEVLTRTLRMRGDQDVALDVAAAAAQNQPDSVVIRTILATTLLEQGEMFGAQVEFEAVLQIDPKNAPAWINLASLRGSTGRSLRAQQAAHRAEELFATDDSAFGRLWHKRAKELGKDLQDRIDGHRELLPVARGERAAASADEAFRAAAAAYGLDDDRLAGDAAQRAVDAFPDLLAHEARAYSLACFAALASVTDDLSPSERSSRRELCRSCLQADLDRLAALPRENDAQRATITKRLRDLQRDPDLDAVRDEERIAAMPVDEARAWGALWQDIDARLEALQPNPANK